MSQINVKTDDRGVSSPESQKLTAAALEKMIAEVQEDHGTLCRQRDQMDASATAMLGRDEEGYLSARVKVAQLDQMVADRQDRLNRLERLRRQAAREEAVQMIIRKRRELWEAGRHANRRFAEIAKEHEQAKRDFEARIAALKRETDELHHGVKLRQRELDGMLISQGFNPADNGVNVHDSTPPSDTL